VLLLLQPGGPAELCDIPPVWEGLKTQAPERTRGTYCHSSNCAVTLVGEVGGATSRDDLWQRPAAPVCMEGKGGRMGRREAKGTGGSERGGGTKTSAKRIRQPGVARALHRGARTSRGGMEGPTAAQHLHNKGEHLE
jgi:hypothetical protein